MVDMTSLKNQISIRCMVSQTGKTWTLQQRCEASQIPFTWAKILTLTMNISSSTDSPVKVIQIARTMISLLILVDVQTMKGKEEEKKRTKIDQAGGDKSTHPIINIMARSRIGKEISSKARNRITMLAGVTSGTKIYPTWLNLSISGPCQLKHFLKRANVLPMESESKWTWSLWLPHMSIGLMTSLLGSMDQAVNNIIMDMKITTIMDMRKFITTSNLSKDQSRLRSRRRLKKL